MKCKKKSLFLCLMGLLIFSALLGGCSDKTGETAAVTNIDENELDPAVWGKVISHSV